MSVARCWGNSLSLLPRSLGCPLWNQPYCGVPWFLWPTNWNASFNRQKWLMPFCWSQMSWEVGEDIPLGVHAYHFFIRTYTSCDIVGSLWWWGHMDVRACWETKWKGAVNLGHVVVQVEACNVFQKVRGVSARAVMWVGCVGQFILQLQGNNVDEKWDELVCVTPYFMQ